MIFLIDFILQIPAYLSVVANPLSQIFLRKKSAGYKEAKKDKSIFQLICPLWLLNQDLNLGPSD